MWAMYVIQEFSCITFARQDISYVTEFWKGFSLRTRSFVLFFPPPILHCFEFYTKQNNNKKRFETPKQDEILKIA